MKHPVFAEEVLERLCIFEMITTRPNIYGGTGVFRRGTMFAIIFDDRLFFQVDAQNKSAYQEAGMVPLVYDKHDRKGKSEIITLDYWEVPPPVMENEDAFFRWAAAAYEAAVRNKHKETL